MTEQQRVFLAVALSLAILLGWQLLMPTPEPPPEVPAPVATTTDGGAPKDVPGSPVPAAGAQPEGTPVPTDAAAAPVPLTLERFETQVFRGAVRSTDGALTSLELKDFVELDPADTEKKRERPVMLATVPSGDAHEQAKLRWLVGGVAIPALRFEKVEARSLLLSGALSDGSTVAVELRPRADAYVIDYVLRLTNRGTAPLTTNASLAVGLLEGSGEHSMFAPPPDAVHGLCHVDDSVERHALSDLGEPWRSGNGAAWAGIDRQYFVVAVAPASAGGACVKTATDKALWVAYELAEESVAAGATWEKTLAVYAGPKRATELELVTPQLAHAIDYNLWGLPLGFLARPMVHILGYFHGWFASWGVAIMLLTLLVKLLIFPLTYKSAISMKKMQLLKPELDKLKEQFANDRERQQMEQLKLFREKGVNPLGGCLPMLLQMPVWFALYRTLWSSVDLYRQPFLWLADLTSPEPIPVMAVVVGGLTFVQQKMTPSTMDQAQMRIMMYAMPIMFSMFMIAMPSGLVLYILVNSILTIIQQLAINRARV